MGGNNLGSEVDNDLDFVNLLTDCSKFETLILYGNQFGGPPPHSIVNISTTVISIKIKRTVPPETGNLVNLKVFTIESNQFVGIGCRRWYFATTNF